jgi:hypothetical protein
MSRELLLALLLGLVAVSVYGFARRKPAERPGTRTERESRDFALQATPEQMGIAVQGTGDGIWGLIADLGLQEATATVVMFADGYAGMYWGESGGVFGGQSRQNVRLAARAAIAAMDGKSALFGSRGIQQVPNEGAVRLYVRRYGDLLCSEEVPLKVLAAGGHPLSQVYSLVNETMTELRRATETGA